MEEESLRSHVNSVFDVYEVDRDGDTIKFYGIPRIKHEDIYLELVPEFSSRGYNLRLDTEYGEKVVIAEPQEKNIPWKNIALALITLGTTLFAGSFWYSVNPLQNPLSLLKGWPFALSIMGVLGAHEFGHYAMSRYHGVDATLPYFIPFPPPIGTMGAVIRVKGVIPSRKALFDIGIAGPALGLVATIIVTAIGLRLPAVPSTALVGNTGLELNFPPLYRLIKSAVGGSPRLSAEGMGPNPVVIGGWVGMFVTFLNLLPAGQLDGGHIVKSVFGGYARLVSYAVPALLFSLGAYIEFVLNSTGTVWFVWGLITYVVASLGTADPIDDSGIGWKRVFFSIVVFSLGALCFVSVPVSVSG